MEQVPALMPKYTIRLFWTGTSDMDKRHIAGLLNGAVNKGQLKCEVQGGKNCRVPQGTVKVPDFSLVM